MEQYEQIWSGIKNKRGIEFHSKPIYENNYLKTKVREYDDAIKTKKKIWICIRKENMDYTCIACITIDTVMRMDKKNYQQVYLAEGKYKITKIQMSRFINTELHFQSQIRSKMMIN